MYLVQSKNALLVQGIQRLVSLKPSLMENGDGNVLVIIIQYKVMKQGNVTQIVKDVMMVAVRCGEVKLLKVILHV